MQLNGAFVRLHKQTSPAKGTKLHLDNAYCATMKINVALFGFEKFISGGADPWEADNVNLLFSWPRRWFRVFRRDCQKPRNPKGVSSPCCVTLISAYGRETCLSACPIGSNAYVV